ncbi:MAG: sigma 54-interacting transcriptional regulator [Acidobacteriota bacterium]
MQNDLLESLSKLTSALSFSPDSPANLNKVMEIIAAELSGTRCFLLVLRDGRESLEPVASYGLSVTEFRKLEIRGGQGLLKKAELSRQGKQLANVEAEPDLAFLTSADSRSIYAVPVTLGARPLGVLCVEFPAEIDTGNDQVSKTLGLFASMIAQHLRVEHSVFGERQKLLEENTHLRQELREKHEFTHIIGNSNPMKQVYDQVTQVAKSNATVLLRGESGTGKEMIANAIHYNSLRSKKPLIKINCAALPDTLIESELFGHEKGAFTGADKFKKGRFEMADGGTLFLDEIGDLPLQTQIKLLRVLQEREFERLGGGETIKTNIRLITATNKNLEKAIARGEFREDLYYRLNVFTIYLPPLRERKSDVLLLAEHFLEKFEIEHGKRIRRISTPAIDMLMSYHFPGNVRELENAIERAVVVCDSNVIHGHHLPPTLQTAEVTGTVTDLSLKSATDAFERGMIQDALKSTRGNVAKAALQLDSSERILGYRIKKYGIDTMRFRR